MCCLPEGYPHCSPLGVCIQDIGDRIRGGVPQPGDQLLHLRQAAEGGRHGSPVLGAGLHADCPLPGHCVCVEQHPGHARAGFEENTIEWSFIFWDLIYFLPNTKLLF